MHPTCHDMVDRSGRRCAHLKGTRTEVDGHPEISAKRSLASSFDARRLLFVPLDCVPQTFSKRDFGRET